MKDIIRIARKDHVCDQCANPITPGQKYIDRQFKQSKHDQTDKQIGIVYIKLKFHDDPENCRCHPGQCEFTHYPPYSTPDGFFEGASICDICGQEKTS